MPEASFDYTEFYNELSAMIHHKTLYIQAASVIPSLETWSDSFQKTCAQNKARTNFVYNAEDINIPFVDVTAPKQSNNQTNSLDEQKDFLRVALTTHITGYTDFNAF